MISGISEASPWRSGDLSASCSRICFESLFFLCKGSRLNIIRWKPCHFTFFCCIYFFFFFKFMHLSSVTVLCMGSKSLVGTLNSSVVFTALPLVPVTLPLLHKL